MKFTLLTDEYDSMENHNPHEVQHRPLQAETFDAAVAEARQVYAGLQKYPGDYAGWQDGHWTMRIEYPRNPRVCHALEES